MATIPFIQCKVFPAEETVDYLERRFIKHLRLLRSGLGDQSAHEVELLGIDNQELHETRITHLERSRIQKLVNKLIPRRREASGMAICKGKNGSD